MTATVITLIEKALSTTSDAEALACLKQAKRIYTGTGSLVMPRRVVKKAPLEAESTTIMVPQSEMDAKLAAIVDVNNRLKADNTTLAAENLDLKSAAFKDAIAADSELLDYTANKLSMVLNGTITAWVIVIGLLIAIAVILVMVV